MNKVKYHDTVRYQATMDERTEGVCKSSGKFELDINQGSMRTFNHRFSCADAIECEIEVDEESKAKFKQLLDSLPKE